MIWFTSDFHFCHDKEFLYLPRGFTSIEQMNNTLVDNYNSLVSKTDEVYILGDIMLKDNNMGLELFNQLNGNKHIIRGNHDTDTRIELYKTCPNVVEITEGQFFKYNGYNFYLCHFPTLVSYPNDRPLKKNLINICGHSHTQNKFQDIEKGYIYHVEVDAHNNYPITIDDIIKDMEQIKYAEI